MERRGRFYRDGSCHFILGPCGLCAEKGSSAWNHSSGWDAFAATFSSCKLPYFSSMATSSDATMKAYGAFLGNRYKSYPNIIWLQGGDANIKTCGSELGKKVNDLAQGILSVDPVHLMAVEATSGVWGEASATHWSSYTFGPTIRAGGSLLERSIRRAHRTKCFPQKLVKSFLRV